jgi:hypothetical protein
MTRKINMTKAGNRPSHMMVLNKVANKAPKMANKAPKMANKAPKVANNANKLRVSMNAYKHLLAVPLAKTGLHDPKAPNYHNELVKNMKNYQIGRPELIPMHNKEWFVDQLKRNVWALKNDKAVVSPVKSATRCPARASTTVSKTKRLLDTRKGAKPAAKPKKMTNKQLGEQLKAVTMKLKALKQ